MFCSAMPQLKNLSGNFLANSTVLVLDDRSASSTTTSVRVLPSSVSALAYSFLWLVYTHFMTIPPVP